MSITYSDGRLEFKILQCFIQFSGEYFHRDVLVLTETSSRKFKQLDGILGLSYKNMSANGTYRFLSSLKENGLIDKLAFGINFNNQNN